MCWSMRICESLEMEADLAGERPQGRMICWISATGSLAMACGLLALAKCAGVTWLTRTSVHCAERITAMRSVKASG